MPSWVSGGLVQRDAAVFFLLLVVVKDVNVVMAVVMAVIMVVVVAVVAEDVDRSVSLQFRAVGLFCQVDHRDMLVHVQVQVEIQVDFHQVLALVVIVVVVTLLSLRPRISLLSAWGSWRGSNWALVHHLDELIVVIHTVAMVQVLLA